MKGFVTERAEWLEANNKALERELVLARAELLERVGGHAFGNDVKGGGGEEAVKDLRSKLERMGAEVERLTTINHELRQLLAQEESRRGTHTNGKLVQLGNKCPIKNIPSKKNVLPSPSLSVPPLLPTAVTRGSELR